MQRPWGGRGDWCDRGAAKRQVLLQPSDKGQAGAEEGPGQGSFEGSWHLFCLFFFLPMALTHWEFGVEESDAIRFGFCSSLPHAPPSLETGPEPLTCSASTLLSHSVRISLQLRCELNGRGRVGSPQRCRHNPGGRGGRLGQHVGRDAAGSWVCVVGGCHTTCWL